MIGNGIKEAERGGSALDRCAPTAPIVYNNRRETVPDGKCYYTAEENVSDKGSPSRV
jgi:hypothetical protein